MKARDGSHGGAEAEAAINRFLSASRQPALLEPGEEPLPLQPDTHALEWRAGRLMMQAWSETRNLARRVTAVREEKPGRLELVVERFGKREGRLFLIDLARAWRPAVERRSERLVLRELFRRSLHRQFPEWKIAELSSEPNLEESLSPAYPRALLKQGASGWAALASSPDPGAAAGALSFGLIWLDYLRRRERRLTVEGLAIFLPDGQERGTCLRLPFLDPAVARFVVYVYSPEGYEEAVDPRDYWNLDTHLENLNAPRPERPLHLDAWVERLARLPAVEKVPRNDGSVSLRVRGLEFARATRSQLLFGLEKRTAAGERNLAEIERLAAGMARLRAAEPADRDNPIYRLQPERWIEGRVRASIERIDATLLPSPVYSQVPVLAGGERGIMDLVAVDGAGRLAVLELKVGEDIHLPLQALDYWMRVKWHLERGEFTERGYFPGIALRPDSPRLLLIAPALEFHPTTEVILRYFSPGVDIERIGLGVEWRKEIEVAFRACGAAKPDR
ncbi:MAG: hypothetical protein AAB225_31540 [Acidobacteriota bacterium]